MSHIMIRYTQDIGAMDTLLSSLLGDLINRFTLMICRLGPVVLVSPALLPPGLVMVAIGWWYSNEYVRAQIAVKRKNSRYKEIFDC
jgi:hypothetical protein